MKNTLGMCQKLSEWIITFAGRIKIFIKIIILMNCTSIKYVINLLILLENILL